MGAPNLDLLKLFVEQFNIETFVETGTAHGETIDRVLPLFPTIHTVEMAPNLYSKTSARLKGKVTSCVCGDSVKFLDNLRCSLGNAPVVYWLDAHYSYTADEKNGDVSNQCPLLWELETIGRRSGNNDYILIDDAHLFFSPAPLKPPLDYKQWPRLSEIFMFLAQKPRYTAILASWKQFPGGGIVMPDDVIISIPFRDKLVLESWLINYQLVGLPT